MFERARKERDQETRDWILRVATGLAHERSPTDRDADQVRLNALLRDRFTAPSVRSAAARRLSRLGADATSIQLLQERLTDAREHDEVRADAAVALAKLAPSDKVRSDAKRLAVRFKGELVGERLLTAMATAHALARLNRDAAVTDIAQIFDEPLRAHAGRAALIQSEPMDLEAAKVQEIGQQTEQMVGITPGHDPFEATFRMGSDTKGAGSRPDQSPSIEITMRKAFAIGRFPVTNREFHGFRDAMGLSPVEGADRHDMPVVNITWRDADAYACWLERITGERYRLPSEAEWEYACRAGTTTRYWWGDDWDDARIPTGLTEVNKYRPNPWGVWDLYGHVYEWCADPWHASHGARPKTGEVWLADGDPVRRVVRGGSWSFPTGARRNELRSSYRNERVSTDTATNFGFRLVRTLNS